MLWPVRSTRESRLYLYAPRVDPSIASGKSNFLRARPKKKEKTLFKKPPTPHHPLNTNTSLSRSPVLDSFTHTHSDQRFLKRDARLKMCVNREPKKNGERTPATDRTNEKDRACVCERERARARARPKKREAQNASRIFSKPLALTHARTLEHGVRCTSTL